MATMDNAMTLLWWSAFLSGLSFGVGGCLLVVLIARLVTTRPGGSDA